MSAEGLQRAEERWRQASASCRPERGCSILDDFQPYLLHQARRWMKTAASGPVFSVSARSIQIQSNGFLMAQNTRV